REVPYKQRLQREALELESRERVCLALEVLEIGAGVKHGGQNRWLRLQHEAHEASRSFQLQGSRAELARKLARKLRLQIGQRAAIREDDRQSRPGAATRQVKS